MSGFKAGAFRSADPDRIRTNASQTSNVADPHPYVFGPPGSRSGPLVRGTDPDPDPSISKHKYCFVT
jgi:hypothetical protein